MTTAEKRARARELRGRDPQPSIRDIARELGVSVNTAHGYVNPEAYKRQLARNRRYLRRRRREQQQEETTQP